MAESSENLRQEAEQFGLTNLADEHLAQFAKAKAAAERMRRAIPRDLHMSVEPAHAFRASQEA